jgi:hypothetical protein
MARSAVVKSASLPPPVEGWDTREALADMPVKRAIILDNWFPQTDKVTLRNGFASHATGMSGSIESLLPYTPLTGLGKLFGANGTSIYDVSSSGAVGAASLTSLTNARWQSTQIGTSGGQFLFAVNGADAPISYNGSAWANPSISASGLTAANLVWTNLHQRRLWFGEKNSLTAWYLTVNTIAGTPSSFSLAGIATLGGYIMAMGTWSRDGGNGADDVAIFLTSEGEAIVYSGTDPSSSSTWSLIGVFRIGKPLGRRCMIKAGADLIMVTQDGFVAASSILVADRAQAERVAISAQINKAVNDAVRSYSSIFGWEPFIYPRGAMLIFNIPQSSTSFHQYVFNTITRAPCRFTGVNAVCWGLMNDSAYFGGTDGKVYKFDTGSNDNSTAIAGDALQAFSDFGSRGINKAFKLAEPLFESNGNPNAALDLNVDYQVRAPSGVSSASANTAATWGVSKWGVGTWGSASQIYRGWRGVRGIGRSAALRVRVSTISARPSWVATNFTYAEGGPL